jgi:hypothetical protein
MKAGNGEGPLMKKVIANTERPRVLRAQWIVFAFLAASCLGSPGSAKAQAEKSSPQANEQFPYSFTNFVWWSDVDLRNSLKQRIPNLTGEFSRNSPMERKVRVTLVQLLKEKGIRAEVQSEEPSLDIASRTRVPEAPPPSIAFSVATPPQIKIEKLTVEGAPPDRSDLLLSMAASFAGRPYSANAFWIEKSQMAQTLQQVGYLSAIVELQPGAPLKDGEIYFVPIKAIVTAGPRYHVSSVKVDGGPLLKGKDLTQYSSLKPGDVATTSAFGRLANSIRPLYWQAGYADVDFQGAPVLDPAKGLAAYQFEVLPGPVYHLRSLKITNLNSDQEAQVRTALGIKPGDVYDAFAVTTLNRKLSGPLPGYNFTFSPKEDKKAQLVDLSLDFYKQ